MKHIKTIIKALSDQKRDGKNPLRQRDEYEFLPAHLEVIEKPPAPKARFTALLLTVFLIAILIWSIFGRLDIHAGAQGRLMVSSHSKIIQPLEQGEVTLINVKDGQHVKKGDLLIEFNLVDVNAENERLAQQILHAKLEYSRLSALLTDDPQANFTPPAQTSTAQVQKSKAHLASEVEETKAALAQLQAELQVNLMQQQGNQQDLYSLQTLKQNIDLRLKARQSLAASKVIAKVELLEQEKELLDIKRTISTLSAQTQVLIAQHSSIKEQMDSLLAQKRRQYYQGINQVEIDLTQVEQELIKAQEHLRRQTLRSPVDGIVQQLSIHTIGGVVTPAQALMVIVPAQAYLEAQVKVLNKDIGFVLAGQSVEIKVDSFPFTKYGTINGKVLYISQDAVEDEQLWKWGQVLRFAISGKKQDLTLLLMTLLLSPGSLMLGLVRMQRRRSDQWLSI